MVLVSSVRYSLLTENSIPFRTLQSQESSFTKQVFSSFNQTIDELERSWQSKQDTGASNGFGAHCCMEMQMSGVDWRLAYNWNCGARVLFCFCWGDTLKLGRQHPPPSFDFPAAIASTRSTRGQLARCAHRAGDSGRRPPGTDGGRRQQRRRKRRKRWECCRWRKCSAQPGFVGCSLGRWRERRGRRGFATRHHRRFVFTELSM